MLVLSWGMVLPGVLQGDVLYQIEGLAVGGSDSPIVLHMRKFEIRYSLDNIGYSLESVRYSLSFAAMSYTS